MIVERYQDVGHSPAWPLIKQAELELEQKGFSFPRNVQPDWRDGALVAFSDDEEALLGFLIYRHDPMQSSWWIMLAYTMPEHRGRGVHSLLFKTLVQRAHTVGHILEINSGTHVNNIAAQKAFEKQGRKQVSLTYNYKIKDYVKGEPPLSYKKQE